MTSPIVKRNVEIAKLTTFQNAGTVDELLSFSTLDSLTEFVKSTDHFAVLGKGSNTLINPNGPIQKWIQIAPQFSEPEISGRSVRVSAGMGLNQLIKLTTDAGLSGVEFAAGVPCGVGGMIAMNFGCWGTEIADRIKRVKLMDRDGQVDWVSAADLKFGYRSSAVQSEDWIVLEAEFELAPGQPDQIKTMVQSNVRKRLSHQPLRARTFGSVFKNPENGYAGQLLEQIGVKGIEVDHMKFSEQHANFLVNLGQATYDNVVAYLQKVQRRVAQETQYQLELEVKLFQ